MRLLELPKPRNNLHFTRLLQKKVKPTKFLRDVNKYVFFFPTFQNGISFAQTVPNFGYFVKKIFLEIPQILRKNREVQTNSHSAMDQIFNHKVNYSTGSIYTNNLITALQPFLLQVDMASNSRLWATRVASEVALRLPSPRSHRTIRNHMRSTAGETSEALVWQCSCSF